MDLNTLFRLPMLYGLYLAYGHLLGANLNSYMGDKYEKKETCKKYYIVADLPSNDNSLWLYTAEIDFVILLI